MKIFQKKQLSQRGAIFVLFALMLPVMCGFLGLAVDLGVLYVSHARLQDEADAAALAGAMHLEDGATRGDSIRDAIAATLSANDNASSIAVAFNLAKNVKTDTDQKNGITTVACEANNRTVTGGSANGNMTASWGIFKKADGTERVRVTLEKSVPTFFINAITDAFKDGFDIRVAAAAEGPKQAVAAADDGGFNILANRNTGNAFFTGSRGTFVFNGEGRLDEYGNLVITNESTYSRGISSSGTSGTSNPQEVQGLLFFPNSGSLGRDLIPVGTVYDSTNLRQIPNSATFVDGNATSLAAADTKYIADWQNIENESNTYFDAVRPYYKEMKEKADKLSDEILSDVEKASKIYTNARDTNSPNFRTYRYRQKAPWSDTYEDLGWNYETYEVRYYIPPECTRDSIEIYTSIGYTEYYHGGGCHVTNEVLRGILNDYGFSNADSIRSIKKMVLMGDTWTGADGRMQNGNNGYSVETTGFKFGDIYLDPTSNNVDDFSIYGNNNIFSGTLYSAGNLYVETGISVFGRLMGQNIAIVNRGDSKYYFMPVGDGDPNPATPPKPIRLVE